MVVGTQFGNSSRADRAALSACGRAVCPVGASCVSTCVPGSSSEELWALLERALTIPSIFRIPRVCFQKTKPKKKGNRISEDNRNE